ncbi:MAG: DUF365 domain-containing protein [Archaeoglobaceae archaeon]|nr:DUF365 domain-containing protein [Archaeoglobaceae archaeon]MDW8118578.1 DUF365 domain-containing protein [Archaeoglobaceae archaeon]
MIVGVSFPIPKRFAQRFFEGKTVFVKPATTFKELKAGMRFVIYQSREDTGFIGEGKIKQIVFADDPMKFYEIFGDKIFLSKEEMRDYIKSQERWDKAKRLKGKRNKKKWMAIELEEIKRYPKTLKPPSYIPVGGMYLTEKDLKV